MSSTGMKRCNTCTEENLYDAKYCIICGSAFPSYTGGTQRLDDQVLGNVIAGDKVMGDVIYGNNVEYGTNQPFHSSPFLLASGVPHITRLTVTQDQYWEFLANEQLEFNARTGEVFLYGYPVDIDWSK